MVVLKPIVLGFESLCFKFKGTIFVPKFFTIDPDIRRAELMTVLIRLTAPQHCRVTLTAPISKKKALLKSHLKNITTYFKWMLITQ